MKCHVCGAKAIFKVDKKAFCAEHAREAERERIAKYDRPKAARRPDDERFDTAGLDSQTT